MFDRSGGKASLIGLLGCVLSAALSAIAYGQTAGFVAPPRNISDITAILDQQRADPSRAARARAEADANPRRRAPPPARSANSISTVAKPAPPSAATATPSTIAKKPSRTEATT